MRSKTVVLTGVLLGSACLRPKPKTDPVPVCPPPTVVRAVPETVTVKDPELERRLGRLELKLVEKDAQVDELQSRLEDTRADVVRTMAKLQTASRADAASALAEAEVALQMLRSGAGQPPPEVAPITTLVQQSSAEFNRHNYGGALYLAGQAKALAARSRGRPGSGGAVVTRPGETPFALPIRFRATNRGNVRDGPGTGFAVAFSVEPGTVLTGYSYADEWIRVSDDAGRTGWIFRALITRQ